MKNVQIQSDRAIKCIIPIEKYINSGWSKLHTCLLKYITTNNSLGMILINLDYIQIGHTDNVHSVFITNVQANIYYIFLNFQLF